MPPPGMNAQPSDEVITSGGSTPTARGTKRVHELEVVETDGDGRRRHGKRLTTREEISLFEICNQHADGFGKRSDICNWWRNVTEEFTRAHGRPYSWHSVRRKVEIATKQRIKFLEEQNNNRGGFPSGASADGDLMHPQWCTVVDAWLPTWKRWEESETRRIERRDEAARRRSRARSRPGPLTGRLPTLSFLPQGGTTTAGSPTRRPTSSASPVMGAVEGEAVHSAGEAASTNQIQLPPGFENMFSSHKRAWPPGARVPPSSSSSPDTSANNATFSALVEMLGKLNNHLDAASSKGDPDPRRTSPLISALVQATSEPDEQSHSPARETSQPAASVDIARLREELRHEMQAEMRRELERDRAVFEEKLDSVQRTQEMILEMLRQEPS